MFWDCKRICVIFLVEAKIISYIIYSAYYIHFLFVFLKHILINGKKLQFSEDIPL